LNREPEVYYAELLQQGLPDWTAKHVIEIQAMTRKQTEVPDCNVRGITGRKTQRLNDYLPEFLAMIEALRNVDKNEVLA